jgi:hypothetical protein
MSADFVNPEIPSLLLSDASMDITLDLENPEVGAVLGELAEWAQGVPSLDELTPDQRAGASRTIALMFERLNRVSTFDSIDHTNIAYDIDPLAYFKFARRIYRKYPTISKIKSSVSDFVARMTELGMVDMSATGGTPLPPLYIFGRLNIQNGDADLRNGEKMFFFKRPKVWPARAEAPAFRRSIADRANDVPPKVSRVPKETWGRPSIRPDFKLPDRLPADEDWLADMKAKRMKDERRRQRLYKNRGGSGGSSRWRYILSGALAALASAAILVAL